MPPFSIYQLKSRFQRLLRPATTVLARHGATPNSITLATLVLCLLCGAALTVFTRHRWPWLLVPVVLFVRMALNAMDGMLAREHGMQTSLGAVLNELGDVLSDTALYLPFALRAGHAAWLVSLICIFSVISELAGLLSAGGRDGRSFAGPMGKSDRALVFGVLGFLLGVGTSPGVWLTASLAIVFALLLLTVYNRARAAVLHA